MRYIPDVGTVREFCTDFDTTCWANCSCSPILDVAPNGAGSGRLPKVKPLRKVLQDTVLMQALAFSEFAWLWISTKVSPVCRVTVMQLNANGPGCKPQGAN